MLRKLAWLSSVALVLAPQPARALIGDVPTIRRVAICPSADPAMSPLAMLGQNPDGSWVLILRTFLRETGVQTGRTLSVPIPQGTVPADLIFSTGFDPGVLVLDTALRVHHFDVAFDADGTPKLIGDTPTIHGPFGNPAVIGTGTALGEAPGIDADVTDGLAIGTAGGRLILLQRGALSNPFTLPIASGPIHDLAAIPQVGYFALLAVADGRLLGLNPDTDPGTPGPQPAHTFTGIPPLGWPLRDIGVPPDAAVTNEMEEVWIAAANGGPLVAILEIPANPTFGSPLRVRAIDQRTEPIARASVGYLEQDGLVLLGTAGTGVSFDPGFRLDDGFAGPALTVVGARTQCTNNLVSRFVTAIIEVENGFAPQIDWATLVLTAGASSVPPSPDATPHLGDTDGDGNADLTVQFDRRDVLRMLVRERTLDVLADWRFTDESRGRAAARVRFVLN